MFYFRRLSWIFDVTIYLHWDILNIIAYSRSLFKNRKQDIINLRQIRYYGSGKNLCVKLYVSYLSDRNNFVGHFTATYCTADTYNLHKNRRGHGGG